MGPPSGILVNNCLFPDCIGYQVTSQSNTTGFVFVNEGDTYSDANGTAYSYITILDSGLSKVRISSDSKLLLSDGSELCSIKNVLWSQPVHIKSAIEYCDHLDQLIPM